MSLRSPDKSLPSGAGISALAFLTVVAIFAGDLSTPREISLASLAVVPVAVVAWLGQTFYRHVIAFAMLMSLLAAALGSVSAQSATALVVACVAMTVVIRVAVRASSPADRGWINGGRVNLVTRSVGVPADTTIAEPKPLTARERQVVELAAAGLTAREIGARLFIGDRTVETHLANSYAKLGVASKRELVRAVQTTLT